LPSRPPPPTLFPYTTLFRSDPSYQRTEVGIRSPKSVLNASTPWSSSVRSLSWYQVQASGLVKSTSAIPACHMSHCHTSPSGVVRSEEHTSELQSRFDLVCRL